MRYTRLRQKLASAKPDMKRQFFLYLIALLGGLPVTLYGQADSFKLQCPLNKATIVPPPKNVMHYDQEDLCVVLVSMPDTVVKSVWSGKITNTEFTDESKGGVVLYTKINGKDYYFWYTGLTNVIVHRNEIIKAGQPLGFIRPGDQIEMIMYQFETQVDISKFLDCK